MSPPSLPLPLSLSAVTTGDPGTTRRPPPLLLSLSLCLLSTLTTGEPGTGIPPSSPFLFPEVFGLSPPLPPLSPLEDLANISATTDDETIIAVINAIIIDMNAIFDISVLSSRMLVQNQKFPVNHFCCCYFLFFCFLLLISLLM